jgi:hypothetical protein
MAEEENVASQEEAVEATPENGTADASAEKKEETVEEKRKRNDQEYNWAEARKKMQDMEKQIKDLAEQNHRLQPKSEPKQEEVDDLDSLADGDIITKAQAKRLASRVAKEAAESAIKHREASTVEDRIKMKLPDFDSVVNVENIEILKQKSPQLARSLMYTTDPYEQAMAVYDAIKMIGGSPSKDTSSADRERAVKNSQKPLSANAASKTSAIGNAHMFENGLTPDVKKQLYAEMIACAKKS